MEGGRGKESEETMKVDTVRDGWRGETNRWGKREVREKTK